MVKLAEITWTDAEELRKRVDTILVPVGSTEQHGPHCPLGTDTLTAEYVVKLIEQKTEVLVTPVIPVGISDHHRQFTGTLWVSPTIFREFLKAIVLSAASHGWQKFLFVNGHGGNTASLHEVCEDLRRQHNIFAAVANAYPKMDGHAGKDETSIMLQIRPELVHMERASNTIQLTNLAGIPMKMQRIEPAEYGFDTIDLSSTGVFGAAGKTIKPTEATSENGKQLLDNYVAEVVALVENLKKAKIEDLLPKPHK